MTKKDKTGSSSMLLAISETTKRVKNSITAIFKKKASAKNKTKAKTMHLRRVRIFLGENIEDRLYRSCFDYHVYFISYCLSMKVRKLKFETDGTFDTIQILVGEEPEPNHIATDNFLIDRVTITTDFDKQKYESYSTEEKCRYYIDLVKNALTELAKVKNIPLAQLLEYCDELEESNYVYEWKFRNMRIPSHKLHVKFYCRIDTWDFRLYAAVSKYGCPNKVTEGVILRTLPDYIHFSGISKEMRVVDNKLLISSNLGDVYFYLNLDDLDNGQVIVRDAENPEPEGSCYAKTFNSLQNNFKYDGTYYSDPEAYCNRTSGDEINRYI